ncbi:hypothetical protein HanPSC8_Chr03g0101231 [Helianthus annuus]|nr:hypothetical protein HanPSC8_Chr03g0101231 [Helianthus annuus]
MNSNELVGDGDPSHCGLGSSIFINDNNFLSLMVVFFFKILTS